MTEEQTFKTLEDVLEAYLPRYAHQRRAQRRSAQNRGPSLAAAIESELRERLAELSGEEPEGGAGEEPG